MHAWLNSRMEATFQKRSTGLYPRAKLQEMYLLSICKELSHTVNRDMPWMFTFRVFSARLFHGFCPSETFCFKFRWFCCKAISISGAMIINVVDQCIGSRVFRCVFRWSVHRSVHLFVCSLVIGYISQSRRKTHKKSTPFDSELRPPVQCEVLFRFTEKRIYRFLASIPHYYIVKFIHRKNPDGWILSTIFYLLHHFISVKG